MLANKLILVYEFFTAKISGEKHYELRTHDREKVAIDNFAQFLVDRYGELSIGPHFLFNYFAFQFEYWKDKETRLGIGLAQVRWVMGNKAFDRWLRKSDDWWYFCENGIIRKYNIMFSDVSKLLGHETEIYKDFIVVSEIEEIEKNRYFSQVKGFSHCLMHTSLFNHQSKLCRICKFRKECKSTLKLNFRKIYDERGYNV